MEKVILKPSTKAYDGMNSIDEIIGEYDAYLALLSDKDLKCEFEERKTAWLSCPTISSVRMYMRCKEKMLERGLMSDKLDLNYSAEMQN